MYIGLPCVSSIRTASAPPLPPALIIALPPNVCVCAYTSTTRGYLSTLSTSLETDGDDDDDDDDGDEDEAVVGLVGGAGERMKRRPTMEFICESATIMSFVSLTSSDAVSS